ncbi:MAG: hypothetical protein ACJA0Y_002545 [Maricaulis maris]|jgi:hypothetical protein
MSLEDAIMEVDPTVFVDCLRYDQNGCEDIISSVAVPRAEREAVIKAVSGHFRHLDLAELDVLPPETRGEIRSKSSGAEFASVRILSYPTHTNRELTLMLAGEKPFATFHLGPGEVLDDAMFQPQPFEQHVEVGRIVRFESLLGRETSEQGRCIMFALPGEEWRFKAYEMLYLHGCRYGFSVYMEPLFGALYGYTEAQNNEFARLDACLRGSDWRP